MSGFSSEKQHILVVSADPRALAEMKMRLMKHFEISIAASRETAVAALEKYGVSAVVIHIDENRAMDFSDFALISEFAKNKNITVVFLAENDNEADELAAFAAGADDYAVKRRGDAIALIGRITLRIRAGKNEKQCRNITDSVSAPPAAPEEILCGKTILIADDIEINRDLMAVMFSEISGLNLEFAVNGNEAVKKFKENPTRYSLILMDIQMPETDGIEATQIIRRLNCENARDIPIIALTASVGEEETARCLEAGMNDFLNKPPEYQKLINMSAEYCL